MSGDQRRRREEELEYNLAVDIHSTQRFKPLRFSNGICQDFPGCAIFAEGREVTCLVSELEVRGVLDRAVCVSRLHHGFGYAGREQGSFKRVRSLLGKEEMLNGV